MVLRKTVAEIRGIAGDAIDCTFERQLRQLRVEVSADVGGHGSIVS
jgi:hypothetical protein